MNEWISVEERLPKIKETVIVLAEDGDMWLDFRRAWQAFPSEWRWSYKEESDLSEITHWMPLPDPPEVKE